MRKSDQHHNRKLSKRKEQTIYRKEIKYKQISSCWVSFIREMQIKTILVETLFSFISTHMSLPSLFCDWECKLIQPLKMTILAKFIQVTDGESFDLAISFRVYPSDTIQIMQNVQEISNSLESWFLKAKDWE